MTEHEQTHTTPAASDAGAGGRDLESGRGPGQGNMAEGCTASAAGTVGREGSDAGAPEMIYLGTCGKCGQYHGSWEMCGLGLRA